MVSLEQPYCQGQEIESFNILQPVVADPWQHTVTWWRLFGVAPLAQGTNLGFKWTGFRRYTDVYWVYPLNSLLFQPFQTYPIKCLWGSCELSPAAQM
jgi:hypothetical protein